MKIISNFKDYYDSAAGLGIDESVIYVRKKEEIGRFPRIARPSIPYVNHENMFDGFKLRKGFRRFFGEPEKSKSSFYLTGYLIGVAGQIYSCLKITSRNQSEKFKILHSLEEFNFVFEKVETKSWYYRDLFMPEKFFSAPLTDIKQKNFFQQYKVPVFNLELTFNEHPLLIVNDQLKRLEFYKVIDPFTAFNNISGFISGILGSKENEIVKIDDKHLLFAKGFDNWSFKKQKKIK